MEFSVNHPILYILAGLPVAVVLAQSVFFLIKALRRSKEPAFDQMLPALDSGMARLMYKKGLL